MTTPDRSTKQIWLLWGTVGVLSIISLMSLVASVGRGNHLIVVVVLAVITGLLGILKWQQRTQARLLQQPSLDAVLQHYKRAMTRVPQSEPMLAYASALAAVYYGDFDRAEQIMGSVKWEGRGRIYEAWPLYVEALVLFWREKAYQRGLAVARRAQTFAEVGGAWPGAATSRLAYGILVAVGEVLAAEGVPRTIETLENGRRRLPLMGKLLATWGLAAHHASGGAHEKASRALTWVRTVAPYCTPLHSVP